VAATCLFMLPPPADEDGRYAATSPLPPQGGNKWCRNAVRQHLWPSAWRRPGAVRRTLATSAAKPHCGGTTCGDKTPVRLCHRTCCRPLGAAGRVFFWRPELMRHKCRIVPSPPKEYGLCRLNIIMTPGVIIICRRHKLGPLVFLWRPKNSC